jgi:uncharacterized membrane protein YGL010W
MTSSLREHQEHYRAHHRTVGCKLTHLFGVPMIALSIPALLFNRKLSASLFFTGWALQFIGHFVFEKNKPMLFKDPKDPLTYCSALIFVTQEWLSLLNGGRLTGDDSQVSAVTHLRPRRRRTGSV